MAMKSKFTATPAKLSPFSQSVLRELGKRVAIGFPADGAGRQPEPGEPNPPTNAMLAYLNEYGAPDQNIPARPFLVPGIESITKQAAERLKQGAVAAFSGDLSAPVKALNQVGLIGVAAVQERMTDGTFAPLNARTLAARRARGRTGERPLIDSAQMRRAVTYSIDGEGSGS
ncbi:hypothetical protein MKK88_16205 [Methylobacterium sp. E-005]|uniref:hypothetical protein n=1 Tax=Methylobacterium sp. E-005 TaxID=2836549 RepID=UPI001FBA8BA9|nr:hypothetical protein [Methylobacterium sp. E-005]MCJ2087512.1 hypothetical protein [Methylobacterium sp. E-005]